MGSTDVTSLQQKARWAYEFARLRRAALGAMPVLVIVAVTMCLTHRPLSALGFGLAAAVFSVAMLWYGREPQRAMLPGVVAGLVPLVLALCASHMHSCGPNGCTSYCVPACALGGVVAGLAVAGVGHRRRAGVGFWVSAALLAVLTGAMGCSCVGYSGVIGLTVGFVAGTIPEFLRRWVAKPRV